MTATTTVVLQSVKASIGKLAEDMVLVPSAVFPGKKFIGISTPEIRQRNLARWQRTEARYREAKAAASFLSNAVRDALTTATSAKSNAH